MRRTVLTALVVGLTFALGVGFAQAEGIPAKLKSKKVIGDLVPAYKHAATETSTLLLAAEKKTFDAEDGAADGTQCSTTAVPCTCAPPAATPDGTGPGCTQDSHCSGGDSCCGVETCADTNVGADCTFQKGKFKNIVGKDPQIKLVKARCGIGKLLCEKTGVPCTTDDDCPQDRCIDTGALLPEPAGVADFNDGAVVPSRLCAQIELLSTIMDENIALDGSSSARTCPTGIIDAAGKTNYAVGQVTKIECKLGNCKGFLGVSTGDPGSGDPCPGVDKVNEVRHVRVMDGPIDGTLVIFGNDVTSCCFPGAVAAGAITNSACFGLDQDVLAEMGTVVQAQ